MFWWIFLSPEKGKDNERALAGELDRVNDAG
jgi:hypothetical protein